MYITCHLFTHSFSVSVHCKTHSSVSNSYIQTTCVFMSSNTLVEFFSACCLNSSKACSARCACSRCATLISRSWSSRSLQKHPQTHEIHCSTSHSSTCLTRIESFCSFCLFSASCCSNSASIDRIYTQVHSIDG